MSDSIFSNYRVNAVGRVEGIYGYKREQNLSENRTDALQRIARRVKYYLDNKRFQSNDYSTVWMAASEIYQQEYEYTNGNIVRVIGSKSVAVDAIVTEYYNQFNK